MFLGGIVGNEVDEVGNTHEIGECAREMACTKEGDLTLLCAHALECCAEFPARRLVAVSVASKQSDLGSRGFTDTD